jgi:hypothetical protein
MLSNKDEEAATLMPAPSTEEVPRGRRTFRGKLAAAATVGVFGAVVLLGSSSMGRPLLRYGGRFLGLDGGCGDTCGDHATEVLGDPNAVDDVDLLNSFMQASLQLTYECQHPVRLPGPVIPHTIADGGYVVCDEPEVNWQKDHCSLFSFGVASDDTFEVSVAQKYGCDVHEFDPTVTGSVGASSNPNVHFHQIGCWKEQGTLSIGPVDTIENLVNTYKKANTSLNLKIDVEGSEWETLPVVPDSLLDQVDHLIIEAHTTFVAPARFLTPTQSMVNTMNRLKDKFYLFHYHINNCCHPWKVGPHDFVPPPMELMFVRKSLVPGNRTCPFNNHEELNGPNALWYPQFNTPAMLDMYGWNKATCENHTLQWRRDSLVV